MSLRLSEQNYIRYRRIKAAMERLCFYICRIFPVDQSLISLCTFEGKGGFGCNPKYVAEALHKRNPNYRFVWLVNDESWDKVFPDYVMKVRNSWIWSRAYWLTRSKLWIDNYRKPLGTTKRREQYYINVNHYTVGIKCTGLLREEGFSKMAYIVSKHDSDMIDELVIDSKWCEQCFDKALVYNGHMLKTGSPRCDALFGDRFEPRRLFREKHGLQSESKVLMFAPTFRERIKNGVRSVYSEVWTLDFKRLISTLEDCFGGKWYICVRVHPQLAPTFEDYMDEEIGDRIINESRGDDFYELLAGMDAYITDYSSAIFEAGFAKIPSFVYADDIEDYSKDRGSLYWNLTSDPLNNVTNNKKAHPNMDLVFPFSIATNNDELEAQIRSFSKQSYEECLDKFSYDIELVFDGNASQRLADKIEKLLQPGL